MSEWTKVVTDPLGLAGFALFLVFGCLAKMKQSSERRWMAPLAVSAAILTLAGGLTLSYFRTAKSAPPVVQTDKKPAPTQVNQVQQSSTGPGSPNVQGVNGNVVITVDQSGETSTKKPPETKTDPNQKK
jgi:hypothetical protein